VKQRGIFHSRQRILKSNRPCSVAPARLDIVQIASKATRAYSSATGSILILMLSRNAADRSRPRLAVSATSVGLHFPRGHYRIQSDDASNSSKDKSRNPAHRREPPESRKRPPPVSPRNPSGPYRSSSDISAPTTGSFSSRQGRLRLASGGSRFFVAALPRSVASCAVTAVPIASVIDTPITSTSARISSITSCRRICAGPVMKRCYDHFLAVMTPVRTRQTGRKLLYNPYFH
jgi:hypothetical protein